MQVHLKKDNIVGLLVKREGGCLKREDLNIKRNQVSINKILAESKVSNFVKCLTSDLTGTPDYYFDGHLFLRNKLNVLKVDVPSQQLVSRFTMPIEADGSTLDTIAYSRSIPKAACTCVSGNCNCYRKFFFLLTEDQWLSQISLNAGDVIRKIYIKPNHVSFVDSFRYMEWNTYGVDFTILSPIFKTPPRLGLSHAALSVFSAHPFEFKYLMTLNHKLFRAQFNRIKVNQDLIFVGLVNNTVRVYRFSELLRNGAPVPNYLPVECDGATGLYINYDIKSASPVIYEINMNLSSLFELMPCCNTYLYFSIERALKLIGKLSHRAMVFTKNNVRKLTFHPDGSKRFIVHCAEQLWCVKPSETGGPTRECTTALSILHIQDLNMKENMMLPIIAPLLVREPEKAKIVAWAYQKDTDLLGILIIHPHFDGLVRMYKNSTIELVREINMHQHSVPRFKYELIFDRDLIVVLEKDPLHPFRFVAFQLSKAKEYNSERKLSLAVTQ